MESSSDSVIESARSRSLPNSPAHVVRLSGWEFGWDRITLNTSGRVLRNSAFREPDSCGA